MQQKINDLLSGIQSWFTSFSDLKAGMDREGTIIAIRNGRSMEGANAWMLICSILIASLGLDLDSEAVIIGAMLISPLMSPILGIGLGASINDRDMLFSSLRSFLVATAIALVTSTVYFLFTPLGAFTTMIQARTAPTFLDGLVAIFGGVAGIISITRKDKSNAIPGVAIATALMPPLCVTGYGIANADMDIALNSFYLFFLNSFFIALTSWFIIRLLDFPYKAHPDEREGRNARWAVGLFSLIIIIPGIIILRDVILEMRKKQAVQHFIQDQFGTDCIDYSTFRVTEDSSVLVLQLMNRDISDSLEQTYTLLLNTQYNLAHIQLKTIPDYRIKLDDLAKQAVGVNKFDQLSRQLEELRMLQRENAHRDSLARAQDQLPDRMDATNLHRMAASIHAAAQFSQLDTLAFGTTTVLDFQQPGRELPIFWAHWKNGRNKQTVSRQEKELSAYIHNYLSTYAISIDTFVVRSY
ncbi:MAG: DUF389 domain-containing protein [Saprospiraceae bacterium]